MSYTKITQLTRTFKKLKNSFLSAKESLSNFDNKNNQFELPKPNQVVVLLWIAKDITTSLAEYFEALKSLFEDNEAVFAIIKMPVEQRQLGVIGVDELFYPYRVVNNLSNRLFEHPDTYYLWEQTVELYLEYGYFGNKLLPLLPGFMQMPLEVNNANWEAIQKFVSIFPLRAIEQLHYISERALFLANATDTQLQQDEIEWKSKHSA